MKTFLPLLVSIPLFISIPCLAAVSDAEVNMEKARKTAYKCIDTNVVQFDDGITNPDVIGEVVYNQCRTEIQGFLKSVCELEGASELACNDMLSIVDSDRKYMNRFTLPRILLYRTHIKNKNK